MKRGLKDPRHLANQAVRSPVTTIAPMKRGLKDWGLAEQLAQLMGLQPLPR